MIEFDTFCYLQNQKTGCTYVETLIRKFCTEGIVFYDKHFIPNKVKPNKFYFVNVRDPLDTYLSLFNYGLDGRGTIYENFVKYGYQGLYVKGIKGFSDWLSFMLDPQSAPYIFHRHDQQIANQIGLLTYRFLRLACIGFHGNTTGLSDRSSIEDYYKKYSILSYVIKNESMKSQLIDLISGPLKHAFLNTREAIAWINRDERINESSRRDKSVDSMLISDALMNQLKNREWFLYKHFYH